MKLKTFRHLWGITGPFQNIFPRIRDAGYDGIEYKGAAAAKDASFKRLLDEHSFEFIAQVHTEGGSVAEHIHSFKTLIQSSLGLNPVLINSQSGKDSWGMDEKLEFISLALEYEKEAGVPVAHEIHRGRITYNPWDTRDMLLAFNALKICCDFSHWVCVCERLIDSEIKIIELCAERCIHLHARVGYEQGPQVSDPRAPEYATQLQAHEKWWDIIWQTQQKKNVAVTTLTPEFGPPEYHHTMPYTRQPVSDLWEVCNWMKNRQEERFKNL